MTAAVPDELLLDRSAVFLCSDAYLHKGMSGGPLLDAQSRVVGLSTFVDFELRGLGFALVSNRVLDRVRSYLWPDGQPPPGEAD